MIFCTKCGKQLQSEANFCVGCGNSIVQQTSGSKKKKKKDNQDLTVSSEVVQTFQPEALSISSSAVDGLEQGISTGVNWIFKVIGIGLVLLLGFALLNHFLFGDFSMEGTWVVTASIGNTPISMPSSITFVGETQGTGTFQIGGGPRGGQMQSFNWHVDDFGLTMNPWPASTQAGGLLGPQMTTLHKRAGVLDFYFLESTIRFTRQ